MDGQQIDNDQESNERGQRHPSMKRWLLRQRVARETKPVRRTTDLLRTKNRRTRMTNDDSHRSSSMVDILVVDMKLESERPDAAGLE